MTIFKKKATDIQETKKLPMTGKVKNGFRAYCTMVIGGHESPRTAYRFNLFPSGEQVARSKVFNGYGRRSGRK